MPIKREEIIGDCRLIQGDCLEVMTTLDTHDAIVTDPPYCSGGFTESGKTSATHQGLRSETIREGKMRWFGGDNMTTAGLCELLRSMCVRAPLHDGGSILSFCDWRMITSLSPAMESAGWRLRNILAWDKGNFGAGIGFRPRHEIVLHLTRRKPVFHSNSVANVLQHSRVSTKERVHPTEKPVALMADLISVVSPEGGTVLDPFMGAGSTGLACVKTGRGFTGIEQDPDFFDEACRRIEEAVNAPNLFAEAVPAEQSGMDLGAAE